MPRPVMLFTGQWADWPLAELAPLARKMGYDGLELACWGDHFDVRRALDFPQYVQDIWGILQSNGLSCCALSNHLVGQAVCDRIDERHRDILPADIWGDGDAEGVRRRAARRMIETAHAAREFFEARPRGECIDVPAPVVTGFTGSSIWHAVYAFPPTSQEYINRGFEDFSRRWTPIFNEFDQAGVNFALEVHPTEIAFDIASAQRALDAVRSHGRFGFNFDPSHFAYQGVDYVKFIRTFGTRIFNVHMKDVWWGRGDGTVGTFGGHTEFGDPRRSWDFRSVGRGDVRFEDIMVALNEIRYHGPLSVEWEDAHMDRIHGATEAAAYVRRLDFPPSGNQFDAAFSRERPRAP
jgi:sugar phosphate isomerase/epimerase